VSMQEMYIYLVQNLSGDSHLEPARWPVVMRELLADFGGHIGQARACIADPARIVYRRSRRCCCRRPGSRAASW